MHQMMSCHFLICGRYVFREFVEIYFPEVCEIYIFLKYVRYIFFCSMWDIYFPEVCGPCRRGGAVSAGYDDHR